MHRLRGEGGEANGEILGAIWGWRAVSDPLARGRDDGLAGGDVEDAGGVFDAEQALQYYGDLFEFRPLAWLHPAFRGHHARDADGPVSRVHAPGELLDAFRLRAGGLDDGGRADESGHLNILPDTPPPHEAPLLEGETTGGTMNKDEIEGKAKEIKGRVKQGLGDIANDEQLRDEGVADEAEGDVQKGFGTAKRKVGEAIEDVGEKIKR
jgi:uncharacterized protein YjbJ (UPF0337 family)